MDKRSLFDVATRTLGLWQLILGFNDATTYLTMIRKMYEPLHESPDSMLVLTLGHGFAGLFLLFSAPTIVNTVYGGHSAVARTGDGVSGDQTSGGPKAP